MADIQGGPQQIDGGTPHDDADAGNPLKIGGHANADLRAAVAEDDRVDASFDLQGQLRVTPKTPLNPVTNSQISVNVVDGTSVNIDSAEAENKKLAWIDIWSSVAWKGDIHTIDNGAQSARLGVTGGVAHEAVQWTPVHRDYIQLGSNGGVDAFRVIFTNLDKKDDADAHVVFHYED